MRKKIPTKFQGILWSNDISKLDIVKNKHYIISQILAFGSPESHEWLFNMYSKTVIKNTFLNYPGKDYHPKTLDFVKNKLLGLNNYYIDKRRYLRNCPRVLSPFPVKSWRKLS